MTDMRTNSKLIPILLATDQGMISEETVGEPIGQRTVIQILSDDRHLVELYFTAPDGEEFLADRSVYTRVQR